MQWQCTVDLKLGAGMISGTARAEKKISDLRVPISWRQGLRNESALEIRLQVGKWLLPSLPWLSRLLWTSRYYQRWYGSIPIFQIYVQTGKKTGEISPYFACLALLSLLIWKQIQFFFRDIIRLPPTHSPMRFGWEGPTEPQSREAHEQHTQWA